MNLIAKTREIPVESLDGFRANFDLIISGDAGQNFIWSARQAYIAFGVGIVAAMYEDVDATPMEGFSTEALDKILGLPEQNLGSTTILTLGYRDETNDHLVHAAKVRKSKSVLFEFK